jgi:thiol:disulfide interchange protein DsbC
MSKKLFSLCAIAATVMSLTATATELSKSEVSLKLQTISAKQPEPLKVENVEEAPLPGFYQVITDKGIIYTSKDGSYLISGSVHRFDDSMKDLTKDRLLIEREREIGEIKKDFITFKAPNEKHEIIVFYDTTCGYCHKLHSEMSQYNAMGITVHYAAFPRNGVNDPRNPAVKTEGFNLLQDIWCADASNKSLAFNMAAQGAQLPRKTCDTTIAKQYNFGVKLGIQGTPAIVSMRGDIIVPGYMPASALKSRIEQAL